MKKSINCAFKIVAQLAGKVLLPVLTLILMSGNPYFVNGEGSPQFKPDTTKTTYLMILNTQPTYGTFAGYSATDTNRLFIRINNPATERIYFGIGQRTTTTNWYFRVKDPNGTIISGPTLLPTAGTGFISYHSQAIAGPNTFNAQGYAPFVITPTVGVSGNYYIEFNQGSGTTAANNSEIGLGKFDVTVGIPTTSTVVQGRLFSYNWSFNTDSYANQFYGSFFIYGADSSVTKVDLNGIKPYKFRVSCNSYGALSTNNATNNRRSQQGFHVPPELRLFLRDPDQIAFPSGGLQFLIPPVTLSGCSRDSLCINLNLIKQSDVTILLDMNGNNIYNPGTGDRKLFFPGIAAGPNCLFWDGKDGNGNYLPVGATVSMLISVESGEVDLPIFDVESHPNGFSMSVIRPAGSLFVDSLFYDDVLVGGSANLIGCAFPCHTWVSNPVNTETNSIGNNNTMNTWWFARKQSINTSLILPDYLIVNAGANQSLCTSGSGLDTVQLSGAIAYSTSAYTGKKKWTTTGTGSFFPSDSIYNVKYIPSQSDINAGSVTIYLGPQSGCTNPLDTMLVVFKKRPVINVGGTNVGCFGQATGSISSSVSGSTAPYTYLWNNGANTQNLTAIPAGTYTVTITSANLCTAAASTSISQPAGAISASIGSITNVACFGNSSGAINFNVSGGTAPYSYSWSNGATSQNLSGIPAGSYTVTVSDANGCSLATASIAVTSPASALATSISNVSNVSCRNGNNGSIALSVNGGTAPYSYLWNNGAITQNISGLSIGSYTVTVTDNKGCISVENAVISQPAAVLNTSISATQSVSCFGGNDGGVNIFVTGGTSPYSFIWNNGAVTQNVGSLSSGNYTVTVTDAQGCTSVAGAAVIQPAAALSATVQSSQNISCFSGNNGAVNVNISGGTAPFTYSWSNGATSQNITNLSAGTYTVTVTDAKGCDDLLSITLTQPAAALSGATAVLQQVSCFGGNNGSIDLTVNGGTAPYSYNWSNGNTSQDLSGLSAGSYSVTVTDVKGCTMNQSAAVIQPVAAVAANASQSQAVSCRSGNDGQISLAVAGGTTPYTFSWNNGATTQSISNLSAGTYTVTVTDANGCTDLSVASITQPAAALSGNTTTTSNISCFSGNNGSIDLSVAGGTTPYSYSWSTGASTQDLSGLSAGIYSVTITDANGCSFSTTGSITQPVGQLATNINISQNIPCFGGGSGSVNLSVSGGTLPYSYIWSNGASTQDISGLSAGVYTVTISDANGCNTTASVAITQPSSPLSASIGAVQAVSCFGGNNGSLLINAAGGTFPYNYSWSNGQTTQQVLNLAAGVYNVTVTDANGCTTLNSGTILQPSAALSSTALITQQVSCFGGSNGAVNVTTSGGTAPYSFNWSNGNTNEDLTGLAAGTYTLNIVDANGCVTDRTIVITQPAAAVSANATSVQQVSCFGGNNGTASVAVSGGTAPYTYIWSNGSVTQTINSLTSGTYTITVTDANGCSKISSATVNQPVAVLSANAVVAQQVSCFGGTNGAINISVSGGTSPYTYLWSNGSVLQDLNGVSAGNYTVTITDANGCTTTQTKTISQPAAALNGSAISSQNVSCFNGSNGAIVLTVSGGTSPYSYSWNTGASSQNINGLASGLYTVTVTDLNGCITLVSASITQPAAALSLNTSSISNVSCFGGSNGAINITASGGTLPYNYLWSNGSVSQNVSGLGSGTYSVTVTDANGCTNNQAAGITQPAAALNAAIASQQPVSCFGGNTGVINLNVTGGTAPYSYLWNTGATSQNLSGINSGNYTVTVTDVKGCTFIKTTVITQPAAALNNTIAIAQNVSCFGGSNGSLTLTVNGGTSPYTYLWNTGASSQNLSNLPSGNYTVIITDFNGCTSIGNKTVAQPAAPLNTSASVGQSISCFGGNNGSVSILVIGGTMPYSYAWSNGASTQNLSGVPSGNYTVTVTDANGCSSSNAAQISQPDEALAANITINQNVSCYGGNNGSVNLGVTGGTFPYSYAWNTGAVSQNINGLTSGTYSVTITDANGCSNNQSITVSQPPAALAASALASQSVSCFGGNNGGANLSVSGGTAPYFYSWSNGEITQDIFNLAAGTYTVTVIDDNSCLAVTSVTITQPAAAVTATAAVTANVSCFNGNNGAVSLAVAGGTAGYTYSWSNGAGTQNLSGLGAGTYSVTVTDANGCTAITSVTVNQPAAALTSSAVINQNVSCFGGSNGNVDLSVSGGTLPYNYIWNNGQTTQDMSGLIAGNYTVTVTDQNGCTTIRTITITQPSAALAATASQSQAVSCNAGNNGQMSLAVSGGTAPYTYLWSNGSTTQAINNLVAGSYTVTITDVNGCTKVASAVITQPAAALSGSTTTTSNISCFSGSNGSIDLSVAGGTAPYIYMWSNGVITQDLTGLPAGNYNVTITDANGCVAQASGAITQPAGSLAANLNVSQNVNCFGGGNGSLDLTVSGGTSPYTYTWSNGATTEDISGLAVGFYTVSITDVNGCISSATGAITQPSAALSSSVSTSQNVSCFGGANGALNLTVNGGTAPYSYNWSNGATSQDINNLSSGIYTVSITDINGCTTLQSGTVTQPVAALLASANAAANVSCFGGGNGSVNLTVTGGTAPYTFSWSNGQTSEDISGLTSGTYTVAITDVNGCNTSASVTVTEPSAAVGITVNNTQAVSCFGGNDGQATISANGGTAPYTYLWNTGATTSTVNGLATGTYTVTATDINGCSESITVSLSQPVAPLGASISAGQNVSCFGGNDGTADLTVNGGTSPYTYLWNTGATTEDVSALSNGIYTVTITDANNCVTTQSITISQPAAAVSGTAAVTANISCFSGNNGSIDLTVAGGTAPYTFQWNTGAITEDVAGLGAGLYTVTITDINGCTTITTAEITQPAGSLAAVLSVNQNVLCFAGNTGSLDLTVSFGTTPYTFLWNTGATTEDISGLPSGIYTVSVTDSNGCITSQSAFVSQPAASLALAVNGTVNVSCFGGNNGNIDLNTSGGTAPYTYNWSNGEVSEDLTGLISGTYAVTVTDVNGCTSNIAATITEPVAALSTSISGTTNVLCFGGNNGNIDLNVIGGTSPYTYSWSNGEITEDISGLIAGTYSVSVTDVNGCTSDASVTIVEPNAALNPVVTVLQNVNCFGDETGIIDLTVTGGTAPYTFLWSNAAVSEDLSLLFAGTYEVTVTDANGCTASGQATVTQPAAPVVSTITVISNVFCNGGATGALDLVVNGGTAPYTYLWNTGSTVEDISNLITGIYSVTVTDANGCSAVATAGIGQPNQQLNAMVTLQNVLCFNGNNGYIDVTPSGGTIPYSFIWSNGATTEDIGGLVAGTYSVSISDANGCDTLITVAVIQPAAPLIPVVTIAQNVSCYGGSDGSITLSVTGGTIPYVYLWSNGATTSGISGLPTGAYTITITDANGCNAIISDFVTQPAAPLNAPVTVSQNVSCFGGVDGSLTTNATGGTAPYFYLWNTGATTSGLTGLSTGAYTVTVTDNNGCTYTASAQITQPLAPLQLSGSTTIADCLNGIGGSVTISPAGGTVPYTYLWSNGSSTQNLQNVPPGSYSVTVSDANACTIQGSFIVGNASQLVLQSGPTQICVGDYTSLFVDSVAGGTYQWYFSGEILNGANSNSFTTPVAGYYYVSVTTSCGTFFSDSVEIVVNSVSDASITSNQIICPPESVQLQATGGISYEWTPSSFITFTNVPDPYVNPINSTTYSVLITDANGCKTTLSVDVTVACDTLFVPNGFSPNDDGTNDGFVIDGIENYPGNKLWVYNRWGNLVFKTKEYDNKWDGVCNVSGIYMGKKVPTGTYYFILDLNDNSKPRAGFLIIRR